MIKKRPIHNGVSLVDKQRAEIISNIGNESKTKTCIAHFVKNKEVKSANHNKCTYLHKQFRVVRPNPKTNKPIQKNHIPKIFGISNMNCVCIH